MIWRDGHASVQAGAGIVADSVPADEDLECHNKARALLTAAAAARRSRRSATRDGACMSSRRLADDLAALRAGDAWVDRSDRGFVIVTGPDTFSFLQALVSADLDPLADGDAVHSLLLAPQGKLDVDFRLAARGRRGVARLRRPGSARSSPRRSTGSDPGEGRGRRPHRRARHAVAHRRRRRRRRRRSDARRRPPHRHRVGLRPRSGPQPDRGRAARGHAVVDPVAFEAWRIEQAHPGAARRRRRHHDPAGGVPRAGRGVVHQGLLPRPGAGVPHRQPRPREPLPAPRSPTSRATGRRSAPRSSSTARSSARSPAWRRRSCPPVRSATCAARSSRRRRSSCAGTAAAPAPRRRRRSADTLGNVTTKRVPDASRSARRGRRRPSPARARARWRGRCRCRACARAPCATCRGARTRAAGRRARCRGRRRRRAARRGRRPPRTPTATRVVANFSAFSTRLATICASRCASSVARARRRRRSTSSVTPMLGRRGTERLDRVAHHRVGVDRRGVQRELVGVEAGEVEQVGDEAFEPAGLRRDHVGGADARVHALDGAVGDGLGVAADRRERRAQVVRHAEQERALVAARDVEVVGHRVDRVRRGWPARRRARRWCRPAPMRSPPAIERAVVSIAASGRVMRRARYVATSAAMPSEMAAAPSTARPLPPKGRLLTSSASTTTGVVPLTGVSGWATNTVLPSRPCWVSPASSVSVSRSSTVTPAGRVGESRRRRRAGGRAPPARRRRRRWRRSHRSTPAASC